MLHGTSPQFAMNAALNVCFMGTSPIREMVNETYHDLVLGGSPIVFPSVSSALTERAGNLPGASFWPVKFTHLFRACLPLASLHELN